MSGRYVEFYNGGPTYHDPFSSPIDLSSKRQQQQQQQHHNSNGEMSRQQQQQQQPQKRGLTLDFSSTPSTKKVRLGHVAGTAQPQQQGGNGNGGPPVLTTPDVQMLKLSSPELAKFLSGNNGLPTPTPSGYTFPKTVTEEQELYAKGFEDALKKMHSSKAAATVTSNETAITTIEKATTAHAAAQKSTTAAATGASNLLMAASAIADQPPLPVSLPGVAAPAAADPLAASSSSSPRPASAASGSIGSSSMSASGGEVPDTVRVKEEDLDDEDEDDDDQDEEEEEEEVAAASSSKKSKKGGKSAAAARLALSTSPIDMESQEQIKLVRSQIIWKSLVEMFFHGI